MSAADLVAAASPTANDNGSLLVIMQSGCLQPVKFLVSSTGELGKSAHRKGYRMGRDKHVFEGLLVFVLFFL